MVTGMESLDPSGNIMLPLQIVQFHCILIFPGIKSFTVELGFALQCLRLRCMNMKQQIHGRFWL